MTLDRRTFLSHSIAAFGMAALGQSLLQRAFAAAPSENPASTLAKDPRRPQFHLLPAANWMNDPNGPIYWQGQYHMFYQYNPNGAYWGDMHWGHAVSADMVHWRHHPVALAPTPGGPDAAGCFSGTAIVNTNKVAMLYTGVVAAPENETTIRDGVHSLRESQCLAIASGANLDAWTKDPQPVIARPPEGLAVTGFRDPSPWRHNDALYMVVGSGFRNKGGAVLLYRAANPHDLRHWEYLHPLIQGASSSLQAANPVVSGEMWECPDFFPLGDKFVLIHSAQGRGLWQIGTLDEKQMVFIPECSGVLDYGVFYAPKTQLDANGNRILWGWINETRSLEEYRASGWAGMMSLPRVLTLDNDHNLRINVAPAIEQLRRNKQSLSLATTEEKTLQQIAQMRIHNGSGEVLCRFKTAYGAFSLTVADAENSTPVLHLRYDPQRRAEIQIDDKAIPLQSKANDEMEIRFFIDGSVVECFLNQQAAYTKRFYFAGATAPPLGIGVDNAAQIVSLTVWQIAPISQDRLTS